PPFPSHEKRGQVHLGKQGSGKQGSESTFPERRACPAFRMSGTSRASVRLRRPGNFSFLAKRKVTKRNGLERPNLPRMPTRVGIFLGETGSGSLRGRRACPAFRMSGTSRASVRLRRPGNFSLLAQRKVTKR